MEIKIIWSEQAEFSYNCVIDYLLENWNYKVADEFCDKVDYILSLLENQPLIGHKISSDESLRRILITEQNYLYYEIYVDQIHLLSFKDTRQNTNTKN